MSSAEGRTERDALGEIEVPAGSLFGVHTLRALSNFPLAQRPVHPELVRAMGEVKLAALRTSRGLGAWADRPEDYAAMERAAGELAQGLLLGHVVVDALQGGAGTSLNMNVNEVLANRALQLLGQPLGSYERVSPKDDLNRHQSTNDTVPTALRIAAIRGLRHLEEEVVGLAEALQEQERALAHVVIVGRTQLQDAVLLTLGRAMGAWADAVNRDRWRIYKCEERLRVVNLGGTAVGTGLGAPRAYVFGVVDQLRSLTGLGLARAENLLDATQNLDVFAEVMGILKANAATLLKISSDLRLRSSGPGAGLGELRLPALQEGSSIMPGKVNPVIPEAVSQAAMRVMGHDAVVGWAVASGSLELNPFLPLIADSLLDSLDLLARAAHLLRTRCVQGLVADEERCQELVHRSVAVATALVPRLGHDGAEEVLALARAEKIDLREAALRQGALSAEEIDALLSPAAVMRLGSPEVKP